MIRFLRNWTIAVVIALLAVPRPTFAQTNYRVNTIAIRHVGPPATSDELIRSHLRSKTGELYSVSKVNDDVRSLHATGFFHNVQVLEKPVAGKSQVDLTYVVQGKPILSSIEFEGNKLIKEKKLRKVLTSQIGEPLDERKLFADTRAIHDLYTKKGRDKTVVEYLPPRVVEDEGRGDVVFKIEEAPKIRLSDVEFVGVRAFSQRKLRGVLKTRRWWWMSWLTGSGRIKLDELEEDKEALARFYHNEGYIDFEIQDVVTSKIAEDKVVLRFVVFEGRQYKVGSVSFEGNDLFTTEEIRLKLREQKGPVGGRHLHPRGVGRQRRRHSRRLRRGRLPDAGERRRHPHSLPPLAQHRRRHHGPDLLGGRRPTIVRRTN